VKTALYTTVHPGAMRFVLPWWASVQSQTDKDFDLWVGVDGVAPATLEGAVGGPLRGRFVEAEPGWTPAMVRQAALAEIVRHYDIVVLVDADDILMPERMEAAKRELLGCDLAACAMKLIDTTGSDLDIVMTAPAGVPLCRLLIKENVFGFSNTAYRCSRLREWLPIPRDCVLADWYLATRACLAEAKLCFDPEPRMLYRQHKRNIARIVPPFTAGQVATAARLVRAHYRLVLENAEPASPPVAELEDARQRVEMFARRLEEDRGLMAKYLEALNCLPRHHVWWSLVAHPALEGLWKS
jgi:hypothetical protein